mmetsp:Transcript_64716/g.153357  ORF Transcript_64716/g.153357 Transcript_64716/m.153357 type:complete len:320 (-) Transcript_64716:445-1404(-)
MDRDDEERHEADDANRAVPHRDLLPDSLYVAVHASDPREHEDPGALFREDDPNDFRADDALVEEVLLFLGPPVLALHIRVQRYHRPVAELDFINEVEDDFPRDAPNQVDPEVTEEIVDQNRRVRCVQLVFPVVSLPKEGAIHLENHVDKVDAVERILEVEVLRPVVDCPPSLQIPIRVELGALEAEAKGHPDEHQKVEGQNHDVPYQLPEGARVDNEGAEDRLVARCIVEEPLVVVVWNETCVALIRLLFRLRPPPGSEPGGSQRDDALRQLAEEGGTRLDLPPGGLQERCRLTRHRGYSIHAAADRLCSLPRVEQPPV